MALQRIADLSARFASPEPHLHLDSPPGEVRLDHGLELRGVRYAFDAPEGGKAFEIGPIDLKLGKGELVFVVGDNGSGKTTLIKLLLGLYAPQQGEILHDGQPVTALARDDYRQLFTTVFSDFYLFEDLVAGGEEGQAAALPEAALPYLQRLEIAHKVSVRNGSFSTIDLSTGQRKRLALVHAYLEGRPVLVFDEWAADQDPSFPPTCSTPSCCPSCAPGATCWWSSPMTIATSTWPTASCAWRPAAWSCRKTGRSRWRPARPDWPVKARWPTSEFLLNPRTWQRQNSSTSGP